MEFQKLINTIIGYSMWHGSRNDGVAIYYNGELVAKCFKKYDFYKFLNDCGVNWQKIVSKKLLPKNAIYVMNIKTLFIVEYKLQKRPRLRDEEDLMLCDFNRKQYMKLVAPLGLTVEYVYILNDWFKKPEYKDVLDYINSVNCHYKFNELPLSWLGLPT